MRSLNFKILVLLAWIGSGFADVVTVSWDANSESDLAGYKIYFGGESGSYFSHKDVGNVLEYPVQILFETGFVMVQAETTEVIVVRDTAFFVLTAYDTAGNESGFSAEVSWPPQPAALVVNFEAHGNERFINGHWEIYGHLGQPSGIFVLNPGMASLRLQFEAQLVGMNGDDGSCLERERSFFVEAAEFKAATERRAFDVITPANERIFIAFYDDCWRAGKSDANLYIFNLRASGADQASWHKTRIREGKRIWVNQ